MRRVYIRVPSAAQKRRLLEVFVITSNLSSAREKSRVQGAIGLGFVSRWLKSVV